MSLETNYIKCQECVQMKTPLLTVTTECGFAENNVLIRCQYLISVTLVHNLVTSNSGQVCEDLPVCGGLHVLPHQHGHRRGQIQVHRQVPVPAGGQR